MTIAEGIRKLRHAFGETQQDFAIRLGLYTSSIAHYECGDRSPDYVVMLRLHRAAIEVARNDLVRFFLSVIERRDVLGCGSLPNRKKSRK